ncbi:MAG: hypothetical protein ACI4WU_04170 [Bacilli bacterium]
MKINNVDIDIDEAIKLADVDKIVLKRRKNNILLSDYQMMILKERNFNLDKITNINELLFEIEEYLNNNYDNELDLIGSQLAEFIYYQQTNK